MTTETVATASPLVPHSGAGAVRIPHIMRRDDIGRRLGGALSRMVAASSRAAIACAAGISACRLSRWTGGEEANKVSHFGALVWDWESNGHDTEELFVCLRAIQAQARLAGRTDADLVEAFRIATDAENHAEGVQNRLQACVAWTGDVLAVCRATEEEMTKDGRMLALGYELEARRLDVRTGERRR